MRASRERAIRLLRGLESRAEPIAQRLDRVGGGRHARSRVPTPLSREARVRLMVAGALLVGAAALGVSTFLTAFALTQTGTKVAPLIWMRCIVLSGLTCSLIYFLWRAMRGLWWAFRRLQLFTRVFPVVSVALAFIPGVFPEWLRVEQLVLAALLLGVAVLLGSGVVQRAFTRRPTAG